MKKTKEVAVHHVRPARVAVIGLLTLLPLFLANALVANAVQPVASWLSFSLAAPFANPVSLLVLVGSLALIIWGAFLNLRIHWQKGARRIYPVNLLISLLLIFIVFAFVGAFAEEFYRCEILRLPYCA